jgi:hypothetical protein
MADAERARGDEILYTENMSYCSSVAILTDKQFDGKYASRSMAHITGSSNNGVRLFGGIANDEFKTDKGVDTNLFFLKMANEIDHRPSKVVVFLGGSLSQEDGVNFLQQRSTKLLLQYAKPENIEIRQGAAAGGVNAFGEVCDQEGNVCDLQGHTSNTRFLGQQVDAQTASSMLGLVQPKPVTFSIPLEESSSEPENESSSLEASSSQTLDESEAQPTRTEPYRPERWQMRGANQGDSARDFFSLRHQYRNRNND